MSDVKYKYVECKINVIKYAYYYNVLVIPEFCTPLIKDLHDYVKSKTKPNKSNYKAYHELYNLLKYDYVCDDHTKTLLIEWFSKFNYKIKLKSICIEDEYKIIMDIRKRNSFMFPKYEQNILTDDIKHYVKLGIWEKPIEKNGGKIDDEKIKYKAFSSFNIISDLKKFNY